jgi:hypothetical protein
VTMKCAIKERVACGQATAMLLGWRSLAMSDSHVNKYGH